MRVCAGKENANKCKTKKKKGTQSSVTAYVKMVVRSTRTCVCVCVLVHVNACVFISLCNGEDIQDAIVCVGVCERER